ncbi:phasin family protein [Pseudoxanthomonas suwonensis]|uniref:Phasin domain-containing protein n=1 Tax=Pseudoxanthomonas suwonensis TaxID=314722 RepID=A0A0E3Z265_9GAMM|nr:phasin family protein [Pseudoxanthomonas suwonensis]AKC87104.1 hypothetical protein WQ53_10460 [Pseudoxanthomonas suwonensis]
MKDPTALPLALYQANVNLQARLAELAQDSSRHWLELGQRLVNDGIVEGSAELQEILYTQDWQKLASVPADAFWRQLQQRFGDQQAAAQIAVAAQSAFTQGLQDALLEWQRDTFAALDEAGLPLPTLEADWTALFGGWEAALQPAAPTPAAPAQRPAKKAAPRKAAAKKAPAKKAAGKTAARPARKAAKKATKKTAKKAGKAR